MRMRTLAACLLLIGAVRCATGAGTAPAAPVETARDSMPAAGAQSVRPPAVPAEAPGTWDMITRIPSDWVRWGSETVRRDALLPWAAVGVATAATIATDHPGYQWLATPYAANATFRKTSDALTFIGDGKFQFGIALLFAGYGWGWHDARALRTASQTVEVILACGTVVQLLKHVTGRESPFVATRPTGRWVFFPNQIEYFNHVPHFDAFPSGHLATALATLTVIVENYPEARWIPYVGYPMLGGLVVGLVASGIHWWSDFPLSILLGYEFGRIVAHPAGAEREQASGARLGVRALSDGTPAADLSWSW